MNSHMTLRRQAEPMRPRFNLVDGVLRLWLFSSMIFSIGVAVWAAFAQ